MHCISRLVSRQLPSLTTRNLHLSAMAPVAVGDKIPSVALFENSPGNKVDLAELCAGKKVSYTSPPLTILANVDALWARL